MSVPSDNEDSKKRQEALSNRDSSGDESKEIGPDGKKRKRQSKNLSKPAGVLADLETSPGTSNNSKTGKNGNTSKGTELTAENSGDKNVGEVRDDIEQLKLNEEMAKDSEKKICETTGHLQTIPGIDLQPQPGDPVSGTTIDDEVVQPTSINVLENEADVSEANISSHSSGSLETHGHAPPNTLNDSLDTDEMSKDMNIFPSSEADLKRAAFAQHTENTLDDVSDITSDISDLQTDSSSGRQSAFHSAQQDARPLDDIDECSVSDYKTVKSVMQEKSEDSEALSDEKKLLMCGRLPTGNVNVSDYKTARDVDSSQSNFEDQTGEAKNIEVEEGGLSKSKCVDEEKENILDVKLDSSKDNYSDEVVAKTGELMPEIHIDDESSNMDIGEEAMADVVRDPEEKAEDREDPQEENINIVEQERGEYLEEQVARFEMEDSIHDQEDSEGQRGADGQRRGSEQISEHDGSERQGTSDDQSNMVDEEASGNQENESEQENNLVNFADGEFARYPIDSTTSDSGFDNSDAVFMRNDRPNEFAQYEVHEALHDNSDDTSSLAASGFAGLNELQRWIGAGDRANAPEPVPLAAPSNQSGQVREGILNLNVPIDQPVPSTSSDKQSDWPPPGVVYLAKQQVLNIPTECAEQFDSQSSDGKEVQQRSREQGDANIESNPGNINLESRSTVATGGALGPRPIASGADTGKDNIPDDVDNNANQDEDLLKNGKSQTALNPNASRHLVRDNSEQLSSSSMEHSQDSSFADMDEAIESSDYSKSEGNVQLQGGLKPTPKVPRSDDRPLIVGPKTSEADKKKPSQKRLAKVSVENMLKKKRKDGKESCKYQALKVDMAMETSSSDENAEE